MSKLVNNACLWWKKLNFIFFMSLYIFSGVAWSGYALTHTQHSLRNDGCLFSPLSDHFLSRKMITCVWNVCAAFRAERKLFLEDLSCLSWNIRCQQNRLCESWFIFTGRGKLEATHRACGARKAARKSAELSHTFAQICQKHFVCLTLNRTEKKIQPYQHLRSPNAHNCTENSQAQKDTAKRKEIPAKLRL